MTTFDDFLSALDEHEKRRAIRYLLASDAENIENDVLIGASGSGSEKEFGASIVNSGKLPATYDGSIYEQLTGSALYQATQFKMVFDEINAKKTASWVADNILKLVAFTINLPVLDAFDLTQYLADNPQISIDAETLAESIYCSGNFASGVFAYASDTANHTEAEFAYIIDMASDIPQSTINDWIAEGKLQPDDAYIDYACYRVEPETLVIPAQANINGLYDYSVGTTLNRFLNKRVRIELSGYWENVNGQVHDGLYLVSSGGSVSSKKFQRLGTISPVPDYKSTHQYAMIQTIPSSINSSAIRFDTGMDGSASSGTITMTITDIGEALI